MAWVHSRRMEYYSLGNIEIMRSYHFLFCQPVFIEIFDMTLDCPCVFI